MASGVINSLIQESLSQLEAESAAVLSELAELHIHDTPPIIAPLHTPGAQAGVEQGINTGAESSATVEALQKLEIVQEGFSEINSIVMQLHGSGASKYTDSNVNKKTLSLKKIKKVLKPFASGSILESVKGEIQATNALTEKEFEIVGKFEGLISNSTLPLGEDLLYWDLLSSSSWRIALYSVQTLPLRAKSLAESVWTDFKNTATPELSSLDISVPNYITTKYPSYENTYKLFVHYKQVLVNSLYNNIIASNIKGFYEFIGSKKDLHSSLFGYSKKTLSFKSYLNVMIGAPFTSIVQELHQKRNAANHLQSENAKKLGLLLASIPNFKDQGSVPKSIQYIQDAIMESPINASDTFDIMYKLFSYHIPEVKEKLRSQGKHSCKPSFLIRWWPGLLATLLYGPSTVLSAISNRDAILGFIENNLVETMRGFWKNWILKPVSNILSTIRHDDNSEISIMSQKSLDSDLESLKRMVIDYTVENTPEYKDLRSTDAELLKQELDHMVSSGDMTPMMKGYEQDIKRPLKNIVSGRLPRALLIQLQKTKVDGAIAISGIDKLLKSQELVFGIVAASPALLVVLYLIRATNAYVQKGYISRGAGKNKLIVSRSLNNVERLLTSLEDSEGEELDYVNGMLLLEIISLRDAGLLLVSSSRRSEWIRDVNDLVNSKSTTRSRLATVTRIYHVYGQLFS